MGCHLLAIILFIIGFLLINFFFLHFCTYLYRVLVKIKTKKVDTETANIKKKNAKEKMKLKDQTLVVQLENIKKKK